MNEMGTISLLRSPTQGNPWQIFPTFEEREGCLWSCAPPALPVQVWATGWMPLQWPVPVLRACIAAPQGRSRGVNGRAASQRLCLQ